MNPHEELPPEVAPRAYYRPAGLEAGRRDRRRPGDEHRDRVRDHLGAAYVHGLGTRPRPTRRVGHGRRSGLARRRRRCCKPGDTVVSVDGERGAGEGPAHADRHPPLRRHAGRRLPRATPATVVVERDGAAHDARRSDPRYDATARPERMRLGFTYGTRDEHGRRRSAPPARRQRRCGRSRRRRSTTIARIFYDAQARKQVSRRRRLLRGDPAVVRVLDGAGALGPRADLAVAGDHQPLPVPAARRRPHLLGAGGEGARPADPVPRHGAGRRGRLRARRSSCSSSGCRTTSGDSTGEGFRSLSRPVGRSRAMSRDRDGAPQARPTQSTPPRSPRRSASPPRSTPTRSRCARADDEVTLDLGRAARARRRARRRAGQARASSAARASRSCSPTGPSSTSPTWPS